MTIEFGWDDLFVGHGDGGYWLFRNFEKQALDARILLIRVFGI